MTLLKLAAPIAMMMALSIPQFAQSASAQSTSSQSDRVRVNTPAVGDSEKIYRNRAMVTAYDTRQIVSRKPGRMVNEGFKRKLFHISRETGVDPGTPVYPDREDWWCTERENYYAGGGRFGKLCLRDSDNDGAFERVRMGRGLLMRTLDPPVPHSEMQSKTDQIAVGLKKALIYRGYEQGRMLVDYIEYIKFESDPAVSRSISVALSGGSGRVTIEGVTFNIVNAGEYTVEYTIVTGML